METKKLVETIKITEMRSITEEEESSEDSGNKEIYGKEELDSTNTRMERSRSAGKTGNKYNQRKRRESNKYHVAFSTSSIFRRRSRPANDMEQSKPERKGTSSYSRNRKQISIGTQTNDYLVQSGQNNSNLTSYSPGPCLKNCTCRNERKGQIRYVLCKASRQPSTCQERQPQIGCPFCSHCGLIKSIWEAVTRMFRQNLNIYCRCDKQRLEHANNSPRRCENNAICPCPCKNCSGVVYCCYEKPKSSGVANDVATDDKTTSLHVMNGSKERHVTTRHQRKLSKSKRRKEKGEQPDTSSSESDVEEKETVPLKVTRRNRGSRKGNNHTEAKRGTLQNEEPPRIYLASPKYKNDRMHPDERIIPTNSTVKDKIKYRKRICHSRKEERRMGKEKPSEDESETEENTGNWNKERGKYVEVGNEIIESKESEDMNKWKENIKNFSVFGPKEISIKPNYVPIPENEEQFQFEDCEYHYSLRKFSSRNCKNKQLLRKYNTRSIIPTLYEEIPEYVYLDSDNRVGSSEDELKAFSLPSSSCEKQSGVFLVPLGTSSRSDAKHNETKPSICNNMTYLQENLNERSITATILEVPTDEQEDNKNIPKCLESNSRMHSFFQFDPELEGKALKAHNKGFTAGLKDLEVKRAFNQTHKIYHYNENCSKRHPYIQIKNSDSYIVTKDMKSYLRNRSSSAKSNMRRKLSSADRMKSKSNKNVRH